MSLVFNPSGAAQAARLNAGAEMQVRDTNTVFDPGIAVETTELTLDELAESIAELQQICREDNYDFPDVAREDRPNPFVTRRRKPARQRAPRRK